MNESKKEDIVKFLTIFSDQEMMNVARGTNKRTN